MKKLATICFTVICSTLFMAGCRANNENAGVNNPVNTPLPEATSVPVPTDNDADDLYDDTNELEERAENAGDSVREGADRAGDAVREGAQDIKDAVTNPTANP